MVMNFKIEQVRRDHKSISSSEGGWLVNFDSSACNALSLMLELSDANDPFIAKRRRALPRKAGASKPNTGDKFRTFDVLLS